MAGGSWPRRPSEARAPAPQRPPCSPCSSKLYFKNPDKADLGTYSVSVSDTEGVSSSFVLDEKGNAQGPRPACFRYWH